MTIAIVMLLVSGYVFGSVSFSYLIAKKVAGIDIRQHGSKNAGATNTLRVLGKGPAAIVLLLDSLKGVVPVLLTLAIVGEPVWVIVVGILAIIGHNWPVFYRFKGGKGVATTIGVLFSIAFWPSLLAGVMAVLIIIVFRYVSVGSLTFIALTPILFYWFNQPVAYIVGTMIITLLAFIRHSTNIKRLLKGEEHKLGSQNAT